ncbi:hypothetical protein VTI74DRAFT_3135 [Chaetomium olivicolor]
MSTPSAPTPGPSSAPGNSASRESSPNSRTTTAQGDNAIDFDVAVPQVPETLHRHQAHDADAFIEKPAIARANLAVSTAKPRGSEEREGLREYTVLQQHVLFWDRDGDGVIYPWHTYIGFRDLGFSIFFSVLAMVVIHVGFSYVTRLSVSYWPDPLWRVYIGGIHKAKHGSDSGTYDREGRFVPQAFEDMFSKWDKNNSGSLSACELWSMIKGHRLAVDPYGWGAAIFEFGTTWLLLQKDGHVSKEDLRQTYDGTIFFKIKEARDQGKQWHKGFFPRDLLDIFERSSLHAKEM